MKPWDDKPSRGSIVLALLASCLLTCGTSQTRFSIPVCDEAGCHCYIPGFTICNHVCVNLGFDHDNCGACGNACDSGDVCANGSCGSSCGQAMQCGDRCQYDTSPYDCGGCGKRCDVACENGACVGMLPPDMQCSDGLTNCSGVCVDIAHDLNNCGGCGQRCDSDSTCFIQLGAGMCCDAGNQVCGETCSDLQNDSQNCSACGEICPDGTSCIGGFCQ
jgi:hypothetical protein